MITEQELKEKCTPEDIKWMVELAEEFEYKNGHVWFGLWYVHINEIKNEQLLFSLLIHRAVEGWNKKCPQHAIHTWSSLIECLSDCELPPFDYYFKNYQPQSLTHAENAMLHCLLDVFKKQEERDEN